MPYLERPAARLYYETWGEASHPWVTLVNGHTRTLTDFRAMAKYLVGQGWQVLSFDNRGAGKTEWTESFTIDDMSDDIEALWRQLGVEASSLLGISLGGLIAMEVALRKPKPLQKLVLVSTAASSTHFPNETPGPDVEVAMLKYFSPAFAEKHAVLVKALAKETAKAFTDPKLRAGADAQRRVLEGIDLRGQLPLLTCPTLVVHGEDDKIISIDSAREIAKLIPGGDLQVVIGVGHLLLAEMPQPFYDLVANYLR